MFGHMPEFFLVMVLGLIVFGPEKLPEVARNVGKVVRELRQAVDVNLNSRDETPVDDFSSYYYESLARSGESVPPAATEVEIEEWWNEPPVEMELDEERESYGVPPAEMEAEGTSEPSGAKPLVPDQPA